MSRRIASTAAMIAESVIMEITKRPARSSARPYP